MERQVFQRGQSLGRRFCREFIRHSLSQVSREILEGMLAFSTTETRILQHKGRSGLGRRQHDRSHNPKDLGPVYDYQSERSFETFGSKCSI